MSRTRMEMGVRVLRVSAQHKARFGELLALFESDELLRQTQELAVVGKLASFDTEVDQLM